MLSSFLLRMLLFFASAFIFFCSCNDKFSQTVPVSIFADAPLSKPVVPGILDEASGIADSKSNPGFLWVEMDSNNPNDLYLLGYDGKHGKKISLNGLPNRDWEDLVLANGPQPNTPYIYLADIGDNFLHYDSYYIYRFREPSSLTDTVSELGKITFKYPDGAQNAEAILVDNASLDIYVFTKTDKTSKIYKLAYPQSTTGIVTASLEGELPFSQVVSAAQSPDSREIIIKTYTSLNYFSRKPTETMEEAMQRPGVPLKYLWELQGEAICFKNDNTGFFTLSERPSMSTGVNLNFYKRN